ncbi:MAG: TIGR02281 family clan AA aspartic protease [Porticoccaceae bacterium]|nr:MAG: TIGR02281 family clan AA aspartic protease [Porticoccaceae bacterium]
MNNLEQKNNTPPLLSRNFLIIGWVVVIGLLTLVAGRWEERQINPNQQLVSQVSAEGKSEVVLQRNRYGHYVTSGLINGQEVTLLLDTGATYVSVPENMAEGLGLRKMARSQSSTANGVVDTYLTRIEYLSIGDLEFYDIAASINPGMNHDTSILLGMSVLKNIEFTQRGDQLTLRLAP